MAEYCATDVEVMRSFCSVLHEIPANEWHEYHIVEQINDSGVPLDIPFAEAAVDYANDVKADVNGQIIQLTDGAVRSAKARKTRDEWLTPLLTEDEYKLLHTLDKKTGKSKRSFDKKARAKLLLSPDLDRKARRFTQLVEDAGGSTIAKYTTMANKHVDGVIHGAMTWNGAGQTGRLSSKDLQVNNMRRDVMDNAEELIEDVIEGYEIDEPADTLGRLARAAITHTKGVDFSDYAQIEARILPWLIKSKAGDKALNVFREGRDLYKVNAMMMFGINSEDAVEDDTRQAAKVTSLACQFGGAQGAVAAMAENYGMRYTEEQRRDIVERWRQANPHVVKFWYEVSDAAKNAVRNPQIPYSVGRLVYFYDGADWLMCKLPCGRLIKYYQPRFEHCPLPWDEDAIQLTALWGSGKPKVEEKWPRRALSHLVLVENAVQGVGASLMRGAIVRVHEAGIRIILSCHDELVTIGGQPKKLQALMKQEPTWAKGLPIDADIKSRKRYGK
jgi:DNA polymerase